MSDRSIRAAAAALAFIIALAPLTLASAQTPPPPQTKPAAAKTPAHAPAAKATPAAAPAAAAAPLQTASLRKPHRIVIQVTQNDPAVMTMALNNAENLTKFYRDKGDEIDIEFVAYGPGLQMLRSDTSPVKGRLTAFADQMKHITFSGCGNTMSTQSKQENKEITLVPEARVVPTGIARIMELQEQGWTYVRP